MKEPQKNGRYICDIEFTSGCYPTPLFYRDGEWYLSDKSKFPLKKEKIKGWSEHDK